MNVKDLAMFANKTERTIQNWIKKASAGSLSVNEKSSLSSPMNPADYDIDEVGEILRSGSMSKDAIKILIFNAKENQKRATKQIVPQNNNFDMKVFADLMAVSLSVALKPIYDKIDTLEGNNKVKQLQIAPPKQNRQYLNQLVREYSENKLDGHYGNGWDDLYTEILYRCRVNVKTRAKNQRIKPIEYLDQNKMLPLAIAIMGEIIQ